MLTKRAAVFEYVQCTVHVATYHVVFSFLKRITYSYLLFTLFDPAVSRKQIFHIQDHRMYLT